MDTQCTQERRPSGEPEQSGVGEPIAGVALDQGPGQAEGQAGDQGQGRTREP